MPIFKYKAKTFSGKTVFGKKEAQNKKELAKKLLEEKLVLVSAFLEGEEKGFKRKFSLSLRRSIPLTEKMIFTEQLSVMVGAGFPFEEALSVLAHQTRNKRFKKIIEEMRDDILKGVSFSDTLSKHPDIFNELYVNMVRVGEKTGKLKEVLEVLANHMKKEHELISKVKGAMIYPAIVIFVMICAGIIALTWIVPKFSQLFEEMEMELPFTTKVVMATGNFLSKYWYILPIAGVLIFYLIKKIRQTEKGKRFFDKLSLRFPILGKLNKKVNTARTCRILNSLIVSGVPIAKSLQILARSIPNFYYKTAMEKASEEIQKGKTLGEVFAPYEELYSYLMIQMINVGEKTGKIAEFMANLADFYEREVDRATANLSSMIEPILIVLIGAGVGFFALSVIQPMYTMMGGL